MAEQYQITCSKCQKVDVVPFKPNPKKPVLCDECFRAQPRQAQAAPKPLAGSEAQPIPTNGRDEIMARMSAFRGLCEVVSATEAKEQVKLIWVLNLTGDVSGYIMSGSEEKLDALIKRIAGFPKKGAECYDNSSLGYD